MKIKTPLLFGVLIILAHNSLARTPDHSPGFDRLYSCAKKLNRITPILNYKDEMGVLTDDLFYILEKHAPIIYVYSPDFAGKADLRLTSKKKIPKWEGKFPYTLHNFNSISYNIRIPYFPHDTTKTKGYYYLNISDSVMVVYDQPYYERGKTKIRRLDPPQIIGPHNLSNYGIDRFLAGKPQRIPDFTKWKPKTAENGVTIVSVTGQPDHGAEYFPLNIEGRIWDKSGHKNFSPGARKVLISHLTFALHHLRPVHKVGDGSGCKGHLGCNWTWDEKMVAREQAQRQDVLETCRAALPQR